MPQQQAVMATDAMTSAQRIPGGFDSALFALPEPLVVLGFDFVDASVLAFPSSFASAFLSSASALVSDAVVSAALSLVFGCAPVFNSFFTMYKQGTWGEVNAFFAAGLILAAVGAMTVLFFAPVQHKAPEKKEPEKKPADEAGGAKDGAKDAGKNGEKGEGKK